MFYDLEWKVIFRIWKKKNRWKGAKRADRGMVKLLKERSMYKKFGKKRIQEIENFMNNYPGKMFDGLSSNEVYRLAYEKLWDTDI